MFKVILIFVSFLFISCSSSNNEGIISDQNLYENNLLEDYELYEKAEKYISSNQLDLAMIELDKIEVLFPSSKYSNKGMLVKAYINFIRKDYEKTRAIAESYKNYYPGSKDIVYASYLDAMTYFVLIKKPNYSQKNAKIAQEKFNFILNAHPNSKYEIDIITKKQIINNSLAANKLSTAKFYLNKKNVSGSLIYLKDIYQNHTTSLSIEETLFLIVKIYHLIEEQDLAEKYAAILAYNFPNSPWYEKSFNIINNNEDKDIIKESLLDKYNPLKILKKKQLEESFEIQRID